MSAPRFEIVRGDAGHHARFRASNGRVVWWTETYHRRRDALHAVSLIARPLDAALTRVGVRTITDKVLPVEVRDVDERTPPPESPTLTPPFYVTTAFTGDEFWHDSEYHYRNCFGEECREGTPPKGRDVRGRFGSAVPS